MAKQLREQQTHQVLLVFELDNGHHRAEHLLGDHLHVVCAVGQHCRLEKTTCNNRMLWRMTTAQKRRPQARTRWQKLDWVITGETQHRNREGAGTRKHNAAEQARIDRTATHYGLSKQTT